MDTLAKKQVPQVVDRGDYLVRLGGESWKWSSHNLDIKICPLKNYKIFFIALIKMCGRITRIWHGEANNTPVTLPSSLFVRSVTRLDGARAKKQVWRPHVRSWGLSVASILHWRKYLQHCWNFLAPPTVIRRPSQWVGGPIAIRRPWNCSPLIPSLRRCFSRCTYCCKRLHRS